MNHSGMSEYRTTPVVTTYKSDGQTKISEKFSNTSISGYKTIPSEKHYDNSGNLSSISTNFGSKAAERGMDKLPTRNITASLILQSKTQGVTFSTSEIKNKKGETVVTYNHADKKYYDKSGNEITEKQASDIIAKLDEKAILVQNVKKQEQA